MPHLHAVSEIPACPVCLDTLGRCGGPATLPCGHNGCRDCLAPLLSRKDPRCPLCRKLLPSALDIAVNHELRDLVALATMLYLDEREKQDGWEAFPDGQTAARSYKDDVKQHIQEQNRQVAEPSGDGISGHNRAAGSIAPRGAEDRDVLALEPPQWLPDSYASACGGCHLQFRPLTRLKHHCRMCGKIFCNSCCHKRMLLPPKFASREPRRVCELCSSLLGPLQPFLAGTQSAAVQPPVHDAIDSVSLRSWFNKPWSYGLEEDIYKGANILQTFTRAVRLRSEESLPMALLQGCRALVLLSSVKLGAGWSCSFGTGLVVARSPGGGWTAPCAVACCGMGWGLQFGGELADMMLVLRTEEQLLACCAGTQLGLGGNLGLSMGPMGRHADAAVMLGSRGTTAPIYSYSCSKGAFIGAALEGSVMMIRNPVNEKFYGYTVSAHELLLEESVPQPPAASTLYDALHSLAHKYEIRTPFSQHQLQQQAQTQPQQRQQLPQAQVEALQSRVEAEGSTSASAPSLTRAAGSISGASAPSLPAAASEDDSSSDERVAVGAAPWSHSALAALNPLNPASASAPEAAAHAPAWPSPNTILRPPAFMLSTSALPSAQSESDSIIASLPSAPTTRTTAPQLRSRPRPYQQQQQQLRQDDDMPYGFLFDDV